MNWFLFVVDILDKSSPKSLLILTFLLVVPQTTVFAPVSFMAAGPFFRHAPLR